MSNVCEQLISLDFHSLIHKHWKRGDLPLYFKSAHNNGSLSSDQVRTAFVQLNIYRIVPSYLFGIHDKYGGDDYFNPFS